MKNIIISLSTSKKVAEKIQALLANSGIGSYVLLIDTATIAKVYKEIGKASHFLFLCEKLMLENAQTHICLAYALGKKAPIFVLKGQSFKLPGYLEHICTGVAKDDLLRYYLQEKADWEQKIRIAGAKMELELEGVGFTKECFCQSAEEGHLRAIELFLEAQLSPNTENKKGVPVLALAIRNEHRSIAQMLINAGADINAISKDRGNSPLMDAAAAKNLDILNDLINAGANLDVQSKNGQTALVLAVGAKDIKISERLIRAGADANIKDSLGMSARKYAELFGLKDILYVIDHVVSTNDIINAKRKYEELKNK